MTSCGLWSAWSNIDGSFIDSSNGDCVARMGSGGLSGQYVSAVAHCCQFDITATCIVRTGTKSGTNDDAESVVYCQSNEQLTGCTVLTEQKNIDGAKPVLSENKCTAFNGAGGNGVWAYAQCCSYTTPTNPRYTMQLDCYRSQSGLSGTGDGNNAQIGCNNGYFISGCSGWNSSPSLDSWRIENNQCVATNSAVGNGVYAYVICCREIKTYIPTKHPTSDPTYNPTSNPTFIPTSNPTTIPTFIPTANPTFIPTNQPSNNPTFIPTLIPTFSPSTVSKQPTSTPTFTPTTSNPTPTPIEIVVNNPTAAPTQYNEYTTNDGDNDSLNEETDDYEKGGINGIVILLIIVVAVLFVCTFILTFRLVYLRKIKGKKTKNKQSPKSMKKENITKNIELQQHVDTNIIHSESNGINGANILGMGENMQEGIDVIDDIENNVMHCNTRKNGESESSSSDEASLLFQTQNTTKHDTSDVGTIGSTAQISNDAKVINDINNINVQSKNIVSVETPTLQKADV